MSLGDSRQPIRSAELCGCASSSFRAHRKPGSPASGQAYELTSRFQQPWIPITERLLRQRLLPANILRLKIQPHLFPKSGSQFLSGVINRKLVKASASSGSHGPGAREYFASAAPFSRAPMSALCCTADEPCQLCLHFHAIWLYPVKGAQQAVKPGQNAEMFLHIGKLSFREHIGRHVAILDAIIGKTGLVFERGADPYGGRVQNSARQWHRYSATARGTGHNPASEDMFSVPPPVPETAAAPQQQNCRCLNAFFGW